MANSVNREHGPHRRPVGGSRTAIPSQAAGRWTRPAVAKYASGAERWILGFCAPALLGTICRVAVRPFIDASFSSAKKGALLSALLAAARAAKSCRSATAVVFLSPCTLPALRRKGPDRGCKSGAEGRVGAVSEKSVTQQAGLIRRTKTSRQDPADLVGVRSGGKFVVSRAGEAYDVRASGPDRKFRLT
jgi:hypothetical protein